MSRLVSLQVLRAIAAILIAVLHFQAEAIKLVGATEAGFSLYFDRHLGAGVDLFFVISGFVMVYASKGLFGRQSAAREFLARRIARIVPLYWGMTTIFLAVMFVSPALLTTSGVSFLEILKSYLFIPYVAAGTGLMQPVYKLGWTLNYEMTFYLAFALFLCLPMRRAVAGVALFLGALVLAGRILAPAAGMLAFWSDPIMLEFIFGMVIAVYYLEGRRLGQAGAYLLAGFALFLWVLSPDIGYSTTGPMRFLLWGGPAAMLLASAVLIERNAMVAAAPSWFTRILEKLGDASYAIYLVHPLVIRGLRMVWEKLGLAGILSPWAYVALGIAILLPVSILIYERFEKPLTRKAQGWLASRPAFPKA